jgi:hypothetical protein
LELLVLSFNNLEVGVSSILLLMLVVDVVDDTSVSIQITSLRGSHNVCLLMMMMNNCSPFQKPQG